MRHFRELRCCFDVPWPVDLKIGFQVLSRHMVIKFDHSMNSYDLKPSVILDSSCFPPLYEAPFASETSSLCGFGYSVQMFDIPNSGYLDQQVTSQGAHSSIRQQYGNLIDDLDETIPGFPGVEPIYDTDLLSTNPDQTDQQLSLPQSSDTVPQPSLLFTPGSFNNNALSQALTDPHCEATGSVCSVEPVPLLLEEVTASCTDRMGPARSKAKSARGKLTQARIRARYNASPSSRASRARCNAKYSASEKGKKSRARYNASAKGRVNQAIKNARSGAYRTGIKQGLSEELARKKGDLAAQKKRAQLSSVLISGCSVTDRWK